MYQALAAIIFESWLWVWMPLAGMRARRRGNFLLLRQKKVTKEKATLLSATPSLRYGATCVATIAGCAAKLTSRYALRSNTAASQITKHGRSDAHATPQPPRRRRSQQGVDSRTSNSQTAPRAFASLGPISLAQAPRAAQAGPSAAMARVDVRFAGSLLYAPGARRARGGMRVGARMLRELTHRSCSSGAPKARSEFCGAPRDRAPQVAPQRSEGVADSRVAFSLVTFSWRRKRKLLRRRAHTPASALKPGTPHRSASVLAPASKGSARTGGDRQELQKQ